MASQLFDDPTLFERGMETLIASWQAYADGAEDAAVVRLEGGICAVFPLGPEREIYNNAIVQAGDSDTERRAVIEAIRSLYDAGGVTRYAIWAHESDEEALAALDGAGFVFDSETRAMGLNLSEHVPPAVHHSTGDLSWPDYHRIFDIPGGVLQGVDRSRFHLIAALDERTAPVSVALAFDHAGDCGIYNVETLPYARRKGFAATVVSREIEAAMARGCDTASLQATPNAVRLYAGLGFRDLGRILEFVPGFESTTS